MKQSITTQELIEQIERLRQDLYRDYQKSNDTQQILAKSQELDQMLNRLIELT
ncbi:Spo0E family sporulation regulatory protein-aspartic acid phosphatase [Pelagirhabdus alkalitolerans]|uniref:Spo0E family sporulation regulatory protein-aspartic acid phosphatase n=1 Tax=Pelagirhabdus alkalitolerans TaxID=1612202 RepID=UPI0015A10773|nr:Spo0E family sporulation regulatory protein-aspartic acid phosphatase [Pelagirhabdus alkalitolerans]